MKADRVQNYKGGGFMRSDFKMGAPLQQQAFAVQAPKNHKQIYDFRGVYGLACALPLLFATEMTEVNRIFQIGISAKTVRT